MIHTFVIIERNSVYVCLSAQRYTDRQAIQYAYLCMKVCVYVYCVCVLYVRMYVYLCVFRELENWVENGEQVWKDDQSKVFKKMP